MLRDRLAFLPDSVDPQPATDNLIPAAGGGELGDGIQIGRIKSEETNCFYKVKMVAQRFKYLPV